MKTKVGNCNTAALTVRKGDAYAAQLMSGTSVGMLIVAVSETIIDLVSPSMSLARSANLFVAPSGGVGQ
jgi:hypothetical protein